MNTSPIDRARSLPISEWLQYLPTTADEFYSIELGWSTSIKTFLMGTRSPVVVSLQDIDKSDDDDAGNKTPSSSSSCCPLYLLRDHEDALVRHIFSFVISSYAKHIRITVPSPFIQTACRAKIIDYKKHHHDTMMDMLPLLRLVKFIFLLLTIETLI